MAKDLAQRVSTAAVEKAGNGTLAEQIQSKVDLFQSALPAGMEARQLIRDCMSVLRKTPKLLQCSSTSVMGALMTSAQLGLRPGVLGESWLLPFWNKGIHGFEAAFVAGYPGLKKLAFQSGIVGRTHAYTVFHGDLFDLRYGTDPHLVHKPCDEPGDVRGFYATVTYVSGQVDFHYMTRAAVEKHRDRFALQRNKERQVIGVWVDHFDAMAEKTVFRGLMKWVPLSTDRHPLLAAALQADNTVRYDLDPDVDGLVTGEVVTRAEELAGPEEATQAEVQVAT